MVRRRKRNFKKKENPLLILNMIMDKMDFIEEAVPGWELNQELPVKSDDFKRFLLEFDNTGIAGEINIIKSVIEMYEEFRKPDEEDIKNALISRERIKMMCDEGCTTLSDITFENQYAHFKTIEESLKKALYLNKKSRLMAEKYRRQKECKNINTCIINYQRAVEHELDRINRQTQIMI